MGTGRSADAVARLSRIPAKSRHYADDPYFQEGLEDLSAAAGAHVDLLCHKYTLLLLKPDAVVSRQLERCLRWLRENGFAIVDARVTSLDRHGVRALWRYGLNAASRDRRDAADLYMTAGSCLLLLLGRPDSGSQSASATLTRLKGPAEPVLCSPGQLRYDLRSRNYQLNMVHVPDEPADFVRELAVLCDATTRIEIVKRALAEGDATDEASALARQLQHNTLAQSLDLADVVTDLSIATSRSTEPASGPLAHQLDAIRERRSRDWRSVVGLARDARVTVTTWQHIVLATHLLDPHAMGKLSLLPDLS